MSKKKFYAILYLRLSKEDIAKNKNDESNSIKNQRQLLLSFVERHPDIEVYDIIVDDGESGGWFNREGFQKTLKLINEKKVNCVIVKDLSRFARTTEANYYLERLFPDLGVRFIAVLNNFDSLYSSYSDEMMVSVQNIFNAATLNDISLKTKSHLEIRRQMGKFVSPFAKYGYLKSSQDKNVLIIDNTVEPHISKMFNMRLEGDSCASIGRHLDAYGVLTPYEYKKMMNSNYYTSFKVYEKSKWTAQAVARILRDPIYAGILIQGKRTTASVRTKEIIVKPMEQRTRTENVVPAIVSKEIFDAVQKTFDSDTRISPNTEKTYLFSGILKCGECKENMVRSKAAGGDTKYIYYKCSTFKRKEGCRYHSINENKLYDAVFSAIKLQMQVGLDIKNQIEMIDAGCIRTYNTQLLDQQIAIQEQNILSLRSTIENLKRSYVAEIVSEKDYFMYLEVYEKQIRKAEDIINILARKKDEVQDFKWMKIFEEYSSIKALDRKLLLLLINAIYVYDDNRLEIAYTFGDKFANVLSILKAKEGSEEYGQEKQAV